MHEGHAISVSSSGSSSSAASSSCAKSVLGLLGLGLVVNPSFLCPLVSLSWWGKSGWTLCVCSFKFLFSCSFSQWSKITSLMLPQTCNLSRMHGYYPCKILTFWGKLLLSTYCVFPKVVYLPHFTGF